MADQHDLGKKGEEWAKKYLKEKSYEIKETNYKYMKAEVDIIALDKNTDEMVFVEVKTRYASALEGVQQAVGKTKQRQIIKAAHRYIVSNDLSNESRFDIIWIILHPKGPEVQHISEAFYPTL